MSKMQWAWEHADPDCGLCDGSGMRGNTTACGCVPEPIGDRIEPGPEPSSPLPEWADLIVVPDRGPELRGVQVQMPEHPQDTAAAIVYRIHQWDALIAERDELAADVERLRGVAESDELLGELRCADARGTELLERARKAEADGAAWKDRAWKAEVEAANGRDKLRAQLDAEDKCEACIDYCANCVAEKRRAIKCDTCEHQQGQTCVHPDSVTEHHRPLCLVRTGDDRPEWCPLATAPPAAIVAAEGDAEVLRRVPGEAWRWTTDASASVSVPVRGALQALARTTILTATELQQLRERQPDCVQCRGTGTLRVNTEMMDELQQLRDRVDVAERQCVELWDIGSDTMAMRNETFSHWVERIEAMRARVKETT